VDAQGEVHTSAKGSKEAHALCGGLGLLGTLTEFTLQLTETSKTHFFTWYLKDDANLADDIETLLKVRPSDVAALPCSSVTLYQTWCLQDGQQFGIGAGKHLGTDAVGLLLRSNSS
jgi:FAD/FMN-containing dehydrogenase